MCHCHHCRFDDRRDGDFVKAEQGEDDGKKAQCLKCYGQTRTRPRCWLIRSLAPAMGSRTPKFAEFEYFPSFSPGGRGRACTFGLQTFYHTNLFVCLFLPEGSAGSQLLFALCVCGNAHQMFRVVCGKRTPYMPRLAHRGRRSALVTSLKPQWARDLLEFLHHQNLDVLGAIPRRTSSPCTAVHRPQSTGERHSMRAQPHHVLHKLDWFGALIVSSCGEVWRKGHRSSSWMGSTAQRSAWVGQLHLRHPALFRTPWRWKTSPSSTMI